jgi:hypothetical protein
MATSRRRRHRREVAAAPRSALIAFLVLVAVLAAVVYLAVGDRRLPPPEPVPLSSGLTQPAAEPALSGAQNGSTRPIFRYSIIDGGAQTVSELKQAIAADPVVAAHYANFVLEKTYVERLNTPRFAHVSYRLGDAVYWTRKRVSLPRGEPVLTDGVHMARTRCGNQIAELPGEVSPLEPPIEEMDVPITPVPLALLPHPSFPNQLPSALFPGASPFLSLGHSSPLVAGGVPGIPGSFPSGLEASADAPPAAGLTGLLPDPDLPAPAFPGLPGPPTVPPGTVTLPPGTTLPPLFPVPPDVPPGDLPPGHHIDPDPPGPEQPIPVPEPGSAVLVISGGVVLLARRLWEERSR